MKRQYNQALFKFLGGGKSIKFKFFFTTQANNNSTFNPIPDIRDVCVDGFLFQGSGLKGQATERKRKISTDVYMKAVCLIYYYSNLDNIKV